jgi:hypothetical protein
MQGVFFGGADKSYSGSPYIAPIRVERRDCPLLRNCKLVEPGCILPPLIDLHRHFFALLFVLKRVRKDEAPEKKFSGISTG